MSKNDKFWGKKYENLENGINDFFSGKVPKILCHFITVKGNLKEAK